MGLCEIENIVYVAIYSCDDVFFKRQSRVWKKSLKVHVCVMYVIALV